jgi:serine/threonine protein phosphatase PrpC
MNSSSFSIRCQRPYQEDFFLIDLDVKCAIVCDGVGGNGHGHIASQIVSESVLEYLRQNQAEPYHERIKGAANFAKKRLLWHVEADPHLSKMASTLALLIWDNNHAYIAHSGDSRVYHFNPSKNYIWHTMDHSMVQEMFLNGIIPDYKLWNHPQKNVITRSISPIESISAEEIVEITKITELTKDDILMLCTDGLLEAFSSENEYHELLLNPKIRPGEKVEILKRHSESKSRDNSTCVMLWNS